MLDKFLILSLTLTLLSACTTPTGGQNENSQGSATVEKTDSKDQVLSQAKSSVPFAPKARPYTGQNAPIIQHILRQSSAELHGLKVGDQVIKLNNKEIITANDFDSKIKSAPKHSVLVIKRGGTLKSIELTLADIKPRLGAGFEPSGVVFAKTSSPNIAVIHRGEVTVYGQASVSAQNELQIVFIINGHPQGSIPYDIQVTEGPSKKVLVKEHQVIKGGNESLMIFKRIPNDGDLKVPLVQSLDILGNHFVFEFQ